MSYVDVLIPAVGGLLMVAMPHRLSKPTGDPITDDARQGKLRMWGGVLLAVAAAYLLMKLSSDR
jgi:hypothetical protein